MAQVLLNQTKSPNPMACRRKPWFTNSGVDDEMCKGRVEGRCGVRKARQMLKIEEAKPKVVKCVASCALTWVEGVWKGR